MTDVEQLKIVLEAVSNISDSAFTIAILWIARGFFGPIIFGVFFMIAIKIIGSFIMRAMGAITFETELAHLIGKGFRDDLSRLNKATIVKIVKEWKESKK